jgi:4-methylaminobutanoate oxidase (formaldehyde-forming)
VRRSPFHDRLEALGAVFGSKNGWERPNWFRRAGFAPPPIESFERAIWADTVGVEHRLVRESVALIDMTSFTKFEVSGPGALRYLDRLAAGRIDRPVGALAYTQLCNERGGIEADLTIARIAHDRFYVVTGSGFGTRDGAWLRAHAPRDGSVHIEDVTSARAVLNLCGPRSRDVLARATRDDVGNDALPYMRARAIQIGFAPVLALRVTYVGELGYELHIPTDYAAYVFEALLEAGAPFGIGHAGYRAIDSLRMEKGYVYWSADVTPDYNPYEAGLGFAVALDKGDFIGRDALARSRERGVARRLAALLLDDPLPVHGGEAILADGDVVAVSTSGNYGFTVGRSIVYAYVPIRDAQRTRFEVEAFGERTGATRIARCAYDPDGSRLRI